MLSELEYEVLERFAIMTTEGNICDEQAGFEIEKKYGRFWKDWILRKMRLIQKSKEIK